MNRETFFLNLALFSRVNPSAVTYEGVAQVQGGCRVPR
jgi:hypothetical protein